MVRNIFSSLLAELTYNNLLLRHFQLSIFTLVHCVNHLCPALTLPLKCRVQKLGLESRLPVLFDWFDRFILFWREFQFARSVPSCVLLCKFLNICNKQAFHSINLSNVRFLYLGKGHFDWLKYICVVMKT